LGAIEYEKGVDTERAEKKKEMSKAKVQYLDCAC
jgi:hypothetical protein